MSILSNISSNIDTTIVVIFLAINLAIGFYYGRDIKNIKEYALGKRNFSTLTIAATVVATWIGGSSFSIAAAEVYNEGLYYIIPGLADSFSFFLIAYFIAPRIAEFLGSLSVADAMGNLYGNNVRLISAISAIFPAICNITIQFIVLTKVLSYLTGVSEIYTAVLSSSIVIIYSTFGGIKAVTFTDVIQFFTFGVIMPIIALLIWKNIEGSHYISKNFVNNPLFDFKEFFNYKNDKSLNTLFLFLFFLIPGLDPALFQRMSLAKDVKQVSKAFYIAGLFILICDAIVIMTIGALLLAGSDNGLVINQDNVISHILDTYLGIGFKGLFLIGIVAMIMSTADSYINTASILIAYDLSKSFNFQTSEKRKLFLARITAFTVGIVALLLGLYFQNLLEIVLICYGLYMPIVSVPLLLAIFGFRSNSKSVLTGMIAGFITVICFEIMTDIDSLIPGMVANIIFFIASHYISKAEGGWIGIKGQKEFDDIIINRKRYFERIVNNIKNFNFMESCYNNLPANNSILVCYGFFCLVSISAAVYSTPHYAYILYSNIIDCVYYITLIFMTIFITYPAWSAKFQNKTFIAILWSFSLIYNLIFVSSLLAIINNFNSLHLIIFMSNLITLSILIKWQAAILFLSLGVFSSAFLHKLIIGPIPDISNNFESKLVYILLLISSILIAFFKPKQEYLEATEAKADELEGEVGDLKEEVDSLEHVVVDLNDKVCELKEVANFYSVRVEDQAKEIERLGATAQKILNNVNHELRLPVGNVVNFAQMLAEGLEKYSKEHLKMLLDEVLQNSNRLSSMILNMLDLAMLNAKKIELKKQTINLSEMIYDRVKNCAKIYLQGQHIDFEMNIEPEVFVFVDPNYIRQTIDNLVINAITYSEKGTIEVSLSRNLENNIEIVIKDQGIGILKHELYDIFTPFKMGSKTDSPAQGRGVGLALCKAAIEAHGGSITVESDGVKGATFRVLLPLFNPNIVF